MQGVTLESTPETVVFDELEWKVFKLPAEVRALLPMDDEQAG